MERDYELTHENLNDRLEKQCDPDFNNKMESEIDVALTNNEIPKVQL
jgi:hypothetical protein